MVSAEPHSINLGLKPSKNNRLPKFTPGLTYDVNIPKIWVQFFCLHGLARKCHFCILTMLNQLISGLKKKKKSYITIFHKLEICMYLETIK